MTTLDIGDTVKFTRAIPATTAINHYVPVYKTSPFEFMEIETGTVGTITDVTLNADSGRMVYTVELLNGKTVVNVNAEHLERLENV